MRTQRVVERRLRAAEAEILVLDRDDAADRDLVVTFERGHLLGLEPLDDRGLTVEQRQHAGGGIADEIEADARDLRRAEEVVG